LKKMTVDDAPILEATPTKDGGLKAWCEYCRRFHHHSDGEGHRVCHCSNPKSPYHKMGYILKIKAGEAISDA